MEEGNRTKYEKLNSSNYKNWAFITQIVLDEKGVWETVEGQRPLEEGEKEALTEWEKNNKTAKKLIVLSISPDQLPYVQGIKEASKMWDELKRIHQGTSAARLGQLLREIINVMSLKSRKVDDKAQSLLQLNEDIRIQDAESAFNSKVLAVFLLSSMSAEYQVIVDIIYTKGEISWTDTVSTLKRKELEIKDILDIESESSVKEEALAATTRRNSGTCDHCHKTGHKWRSCWAYHKTDEGKAFLKEHPGWTPGSKSSNEKPQEKANLAQYINSEYALAARIGTKGDRNGLWYADSAATSHMTGQRDLFETIRPMHVLIRVANGGSMTAEGEGTVKLYLQGEGRETSTVSLSHVLFVPECEENLLSLGKLGDAGVDVLISKGEKMSLVKEGKVIGTATRSINQTGGSYILDTIAERAFVSSEQEEKELWHRRLGHPGRSQGKRIPTAVDGVHTAAIPFCETCIQGKQTKPISRVPMRKTTRKLERVHVDIWGPISIKEVRPRYMITLVDDFTRKIWVEFIDQRSDFFPRFVSWKRKAEEDGRETVLAMRSDRAKELYQGRMIPLAKESGMTIETTIGYSSESNGIAERAQRSIIERGNAMRFDQDVDEKFWAYSYFHAVLLLNMSPRKDQTKCPQELWTGKRPDASYLRVFGCSVWIHLPSQVRDKLQPRAWRGQFLGFHLSTRLVKVYDQEQDKVIIAKPGVFDERTLEEQNLLHSVSRQLEGEERVGVVSGSPHQDNNSPPESEDEEDVHSSEPSEPSEPLASPLVEPDQLSDTEGVIAGQIIGQEGVEIIGERETRQESETETITPGIRVQERTITPRETKAERDIRRIKENSERRAKEVEKGYRKSKRLNRGLPTEEEARIAVAVSEPANYEDAVSPSNPHLYQWREAIAKELESLDKNGTWEEVEELPSPETNVVDSKWVFKVKYQENGEPGEFKARLVARGFSQVQGVDYEETFAPTVRHECLRVLFALAAKEGWDIHQMDVISAFLAGTLRERVYMERPKGCHWKGRYCLLVKSLYGLKQAARVWYQLLTGWLIRNGFKAFDCDEGILSNGEIIVAIWVDDLLIFGKSRAEIEKGKDLLRRKFNMKDLGEAQVCLGIRIQRDLPTRAIWIDQTAYASGVLKRFKVDKMSSSPLPMESGAQYNLAQEGEDADTELYQQAVGSLMHLTHTRPDITFAVHKVAQFSHQPKKHHWTAVLRILRYVKGTVDFGIKYSGTKVEVYSDTDFAGDRKDRKSTKGNVFLIGGGAVMWESQKIRSVPTSSTEAEYIGLSDTAKKAIWFRRLLSSVYGTREEIQGPIQILGDNEGALNVSKGVSSQKRTKHVDVRYHHIRDEIEQGRISLTYCPTALMRADGFTKPLPGPRFLEDRGKIGVVDVGSQVEKEGVYKGGEYGH